MDITITVITSHYLHHPIQKALERLNPDCTFLWATYDTFQHIPQVYDRFADQCDGFLVSGNMAKAAIELAEHEIHRPIVSFQVDMSGLYKSILDILIENREQDVGRIVMDFMLPIDSGRVTARDFLADANRQLLIPTINRWIASADRAVLDSVEDTITEGLLQLYAEERMDVVLCQYTNIIPALEARGIPYRYPFPTDASLMNLLHGLFVQIELERMRANVPAVICVSLCRYEQVSPENLQFLERALREFLQEHLMNGMIQRESRGAVVFSTVRFLHSITSHCESCELSAWLKEHLPFETAVGYGVGDNINDAVLNSHAACREALFSGHSFIKNERGDLIGPLNSEKRMVIKSAAIQNVGKIAKQCRLSAITIQKLLTYMQIEHTNKVTTQELARRFGVTPRNANRILQNLERGGCAEVAYTQSTNSKGRPVKVYELKF